MSTNKHKHVRNPVINHQFSGITYIQIDQKYKQSQKSHRLMSNFTILTLLDHFSQVLNKNSYFTLIVFFIFHVLCVKMFPKI